MLNTFNFRVVPQTYRSLSGSKIVSFSYPACSSFSTIAKPTEKPSDPRFGSGPCKKRPGYDLSTVLKNTPLGRSHRSKLGKNKLKEAIDLTKELLGVPKDYLVGIVPASDTGAFEMAMWSLLGPKPIDAFHWESFGKGWVQDIQSQLKLKDQTIVHEAGYGELPDMSKARKDADIIFTFNGTTSGVRVPSSCSFINDQRTGLTFCDATSAVFAMHMPWEKLDITTFSWQKVLGGEGAHGVIILSPNAINRLLTYKSKYPLPKIFRMTKALKEVKDKINGEPVVNELISDLFEGSTINTPSMLCVEDYLDALQWAKSIGGLNKLVEISEGNLNILKQFVKENNDWIEFLPKKEENYSNTSICLLIKDLNKDQIKKMVNILEKEDVAVDIGSYRDAPAGLRIWGGSTVENKDMRKLMPWLKWAHEQAKL